MYFHNARAPCPQAWWKVWRSITRDRERIGMNQTPSHADVTLNTARGVAASLPHLLGFHPRESLICLWMRKGMLVVTQRADLPELAEPVLDDDAAKYVHAYLAAARNAAADEVVAVIVDGREAIVIAVLQALLDILAPMPVRLRSMLVVQGSQVRDVIREDGQWEWIDAKSRQYAGAAIGGREPALSRDRIASECDPAPDHIVAESHLGTLDAQSIIEATCALIDFIDEAGEGRHLADLGDRTLRDACSGRVGRDIVLWWAARAESSERHRLLEALMRCTRSTPLGAGGHVAAAASAVAWMCGDGVRANVALDRCLLDDPDNRMGDLLATAIATGIPPTSVSEWLGSVEWSVLCTWNHAGASGSFMDEQAS